MFHREDISENKGGGETVFRLLGYALSLLRRVVLRCRQQAAPVLKISLLLSLFFRHLDIIWLIVCAAAGGEKDNPHEQEGAQESENHANRQRDMAVARDIIAVFKSKEDEVNSGWNGNHERDYQKDNHISFCAA